MFTILGTDDSINTCDCCGRSNLKFTVIVQTEDGEILHYGSVCATRHTKYSSKEIKGQLKEINKNVAIAYEKRKVEASAVLRVSIEYKALANKQREAHNLRLVGKEFRDFCIVESIAHDDFVKQLKKKFDLKSEDYLF